MDQTPLITFSPHCVERYIDRVREVSEEAACNDLKRLAKLGEVHPDPPAWYEPAEGADAVRTDAWLYLGGDSGIVCPLTAKTNRTLTATTLMTRSNDSPGVKQARAAKRKRRRDVNYGRRGPKHSGGRRRDYDP